MGYAEWIRRHRRNLGIPFVVVALLLARFDDRYLWLSLFAVGFGEMLRVWSASGDGPARPNLPHDRRSGEAALLNGPVLPGDASVSQDTVDAMFP